MASASTTEKDLGQQFWIVFVFLVIFVSRLFQKNPEKDIQLYINSPGGSVTAGLAIYDTMQFISCDVATYCIGQAASMGAMLLTAGADVDGYDTTRLTPLVMAADRGYTELAFLFLDAGADVDIAHVEGWTALIDAARAGNVELVKRLLYEGADSALATPNGWRAIDYARHYKHAEVVRILEKHG